MVEKVSGLYWKRITCPLSKLSDLTLSYRSSLSISVTMSLESPGPQTSDGHTQHFPAFLLCFPVHRNTLHTKLLLLRDGGMASAIQNCFSYLFSTSFSDMKLNPVFPCLQASSPSTYSHTPGLPIFNINGLSWTPLPTSVTATLPEKEVYTLHSLSFTHFQPGSCYHWTVKSDSCQSHYSGYL
ncbi:uncharacterized protein [Gorilla gorilla gorilla]|uniref:uncharacterized protein isoform X5 n=1 Tax=Gorilla gorilla gorilla TaxID=9595 RepID=UPI0024461363|nr:uncharacterized protein LOC129525307 isoform X6 [Gorilla gorilla gorilla]